MLQELHAAVMDVAIFVVGSSSLMTWQKILVPKMHQLIPYIVLLYLNIIIIFIIYFY
jgi:hypothetical protein